MSIKVSLLGDEWGSSKGGLSTINRELAKQFAQHKDVEVSLLVPQGNCSDADRAEAEGHKVTIVEAKKRTGYVPREWLSNPPKNHSIDIVIGHNVVLGRQAPDIREKCECKWIQFVHTEPEQLAMHKKYAGAISKGEEKQNNIVELCEDADLVVAIGSKLTDSISSHLRHCNKDDSVVNLTPGIFSEFTTIKQAAKELGKFYVLVFGRGDPEDFELKGFDVAAKAFKELNIGTFHLTFVGATSGKQDEVVEHLLKYGISRNQLVVRGFCKSREELRKLFCDVDLAIMPSRMEGFGLAGLEALSAGLPVLVSANSGFAEALKKVPGGSSCIVQSGVQNSCDPEAGDWAKKIKEVQGKPRSVRLKEARNLRAEYAEQFDWKQQCDALVKKMWDMVHGPLELDRQVSTVEDKTRAGSPPPKQSRVVTKQQKDPLEVDKQGSTAEARAGSPPPKRSKVVTKQQKVKGGTPSDEELEHLAKDIVECWEDVGRRLHISEAELVAFRKENEECRKRAYRMLLSWKRSCDSDATYVVLYEALCHNLVNRKDLGRIYCCEKTD